jgi:DNA-directed RNA polymerase specialized sigma24 family protein
VPGRARIDGADLAQEAWARVLRYLRGANGDRITDDLHLARFLRCAARNCLYDLLGSAPIVAEANSVALDAPESSGGPDGGGNGNGTERRVERIPAPASLPDILRFAGSGAYSSLIEALFTDEAAFRRSIHEAGARRHPRQYRALVLYQLGLFLWQETRGAPPEAVRETGRLLRHFVQALGVPVAWWEAVETAVHSTAWEALDDERDNPTDNGDVYSERTASEAATTALLAAVNHVCGASLKAGNMLSVLRYDLNQSVAGGGGGG